MLEIKKIKKISLANACAFFSTLSFFVLTLLFYGYALLMAFRTGQTAEPLSGFVWLNVRIAILSSLFIAFFAGLSGWLLGLLFAGAYNFFAKKSGGIKIEIDGLILDSSNQEKQGQLFSSPLQKEE